MGIDKIIRIEYQSRGTRIIAGEDARIFRSVVDLLAETVQDAISADPIYLPAIDAAVAYTGKPGERMTVGGPSMATVLCPERTSQIRRLFSKYPNMGPVWYCERCWRLERPQRGRWREFTQFGVESRIESLDNMIDLCSNMVHVVKCLLQSTPSEQAQFTIARGVDRGADYYNLDETFEIHCDSLGTQSQVAGGGVYDEGVGFAIGVDRLILALPKESS